MNTLKIVYPHVSVDYHSTTIRVKYQIFDSNTKCIHTYGNCSYSSHARYSYKKIVFDILYTDYNKEKYNHLNHRLESIKQMAWFMVHNKNFKIDKVVYCYQKKISRKILEYNTFEELYNNHKDYPDINSDYIYDKIFNNKTYNNAILYSKHEHKDIRDLCVAILRKKI